MKTVMVMCQFGEGPNFRWLVVVTGKIVMMGRWVRLSEACAEASAEVVSSLISCRNWTSDPPPFSPKAFDFEH